jgi:hypothetical protein
MVSPVKKILAKTFLGTVLEREVLSNEPTCFCAQRRTPFGQPPRLAARSRRASLPLTLKIEVSLPDGPVFHISAVGDGEMPVIVPPLKGRSAGIRITPRMRTDSVQIDVSALTATNKKLSEATCDEVRSWNSEDAGSYELKEHASLLLSGLAQLDLPVFKLKVVRVGGPPPGGFHHQYAHSLAFCGCEYPSPRSIINPKGVLLAEWRG